MQPITCPQIIIIYTIFTTIQILQAQQLLFTMSNSISLKYMASQIRKLIANPRQLVVAWSGKQKDKSTKIQASKSTSQVTLQMFLVAQGVQATSAKRKMSRTMESYHGGLLTKESKHILRMTQKNIKLLIRKIRLHQIA